MTETSISVITLFKVHLTLLNKYGNVM